MQKLTRTICLSLLSVLIFSFFQEAAAQDRRRKRQYRSQNSRISQFKGKQLAFANAKQYITLGGSINALNYFGDIAPKSNIGSTDISFTRPGLGISSSVRLGSSLSVRAEFMYGQLSSSDYEVSDPEDPNAIYRYARNLQFRNNIKDLSLVGVYDFFSNPYTVIQRLNFTPYVFAGISVFHHNPRGLVPGTAILSPGDTLNPAEAGEWVALKPLRTEGRDYGNFKISIPVGLGVRFRVSQVLDIEAEMSYRHLFFDYIDDVSTDYVDKGTLGSDLARIMADRSLEPTDVLSGENRFDALVQSEFINTNRDATYVGADGRTYTTLAGYGHPGDKRGDPGDNDIFIVTTIRAVFMIGPSPFSRRGFRPR
ncbi:MAG: DUF6089 family protein [Cyclobacteriaceae bacterium]